MKSFARALLAAFAGLFILLAISGCDKQPVATVNGMRITRGDYVARLEQAAGKEVMADLITRKLLEGACNQAKIQVTPAEVKAEIDKIRKSAPDDAAWQNMLKQQGLTEQTLTETVSFQLRVRKLQEKDVKVTDQDLLAFFQKNRERFNRPATISLSEIVLKTKAEADKVRAQLSGPKASFASLATQYSISPQTRATGGSRGEAPLDQIQPEAIRTVLSTMQVGQISQPIDLDGVWYIIKVDSKRAAEAAVYDKMKDTVREAYMASRVKQVQEIVQELAKTAKVNIVDPKYAELNKMFGPQQALPSFGGESKGAPAPAEGAPAPAPAPTK